MAIANYKIKDYIYIYFIEMVEYIKSSYNLI